MFAKRIDSQEARLRVFCMTDDKEDKTLEHQEHFTEVAKSRDIEVLEGKPLYLEFIGNLVPISKTGDQLVLNFKAFHENRLPFTARVRDLEEPALGRILFMREPKVIEFHLSLPMLEVQLHIIFIGTQLINEPSQFERNQTHAWK